MGPFAMMEPMGGPGGRVKGLVLPELVRLMP